MGRRRGPPKKSFVISVARVKFKLHRLIVHVTHITFAMLKRIYILKTIWKTFQRLWALRNTKYNGNFFQHFFPTWRETKIELSQLIGLIIVTSANMQCNFLTEPAGRVPMMAPPRMKPSSLMQIFRPALLLRRAERFTWVFLEPRSSSGSKQIFVQPEGVGVKRRPVFNGCNSEQCSRVSDPFSLCIFHLIPLAWIDMILP